LELSNVNGSFDLINGIVLAILINPFSVHQLKLMVNRVELFIISIELLYHNKL